MDAFGARVENKELVPVEYLDQSAFDEKFEIILKDDYINNLFHVENKYQVPVLEGRFRDMYNYTKANLIHPEDKNYNDFMNPDTLAQRFKDSPSGMIKDEFREKLVDGSYRWVQYIGIAGVENGVPEGKFYFYVFDIQNQKDRINGLTSGTQYNNNRDHITGLRRKEMFVSALSDIVAEKPNSYCCVAIDIQHFKIFNTWFGHDKGNYLLSKIGNYLSELEKKENAVAAYFGRDNFAVLIRYDKKLINDIYLAIREFIFSFSKMLGFLPALGVYILEEGTKAGYDCYDKARLAVADAKKTYLDRICYFDSSEYENTRKNFEFLTEFQVALNNDEITFHVQPQCRIVDGKIVGAEALARWIRKDGSVISPGRFVPFLESSGFITELDKFVWKHVFKWVRSLLDRNIEPVPVSINISQIDLLSMDVASYLYSLTERYNVPSRYIKVEITESAYAENFETITSTISELKKKGFLVLLDDFGAGNSSLNMLDRINVDIIKLDMLFMKKENSLGKKGVGIVESIFGMTKALDLPVIVEGVETEEQIRFLSNLGFKYAQGYYFYKPISVDDFEKLIMSDASVDRKGIEMESADVFRAQEFLKENLFTESTLNKILGAVAYYTLEGENLTISRFNQAFRDAIGDSQMDSRVANIQNYVISLDHPSLYQALKNAEENTIDGGKCEVRFVKSYGGVFWFKLQFFFLRAEGNKKYFFGKIEETTEQRDQSLHFFDVLRKQSDVTMCIRLDENKIQYITGENTLYQLDLPSMDLDKSIYQTALYRIENDKDRKAFLNFFDVNRLRDAHRKAVYHEILDIEFRLLNKSEPVEFSTYYIRHHRDDSLIIYAFAKRRDREILLLDPLTGMKNRYAYNNTVAMLDSHGENSDKLVAFSIDVNGLKDMNDAYGHVVGDELIKATAEAIEKVISPYGNGYRIGGDEFVAFMYGNKELAEFLKEELHKTLAEWEGSTFSGITISCGYATSEEFPGSNVAELIKMADFRMYREKSAYYQKQGVNKRMQQIAYNAICSSYIKILKADLITDKFDIVYADDGELKEEVGYCSTLSGWFLSFVEKEQIHPDDKEYFLEMTSLEHLKGRFKDKKERYTISYRRKVHEKFSKVILEIIPAPDFSPTCQKAFLYVKDIGGVDD